MEKVVLGIGLRFERFALGGGSGLAREVLGLDFGRGREVEIEVEVKDFLSINL